MGIARSLKEAGRLTSRTSSLILRASEDLVCRNIMCTKLGEACVCRLAVSLSRLSGLRALDVANNDLGVLPDSVFELPALEHLNISGNRLTALPARVADLTNLRTLDASNNLLTRLPAELAHLDSLETLDVGGNEELQEEDLSELLERRPALQIVRGNEPGSSGVEEPGTNHR